MGLLWDFYICLKNLFGRLGSVFVELVPHVFKLSSLFTWGASKASTFQMAILLQYNSEDAYTVQQLTDSTQIKMVSTLPGCCRLQTMKEQFGKGVLCLHINWLCSTKLSPYSMCHIGARRPRKRGGGQGYTQHSFLGTLGQKCSSKTGTSHNSGQRRAAGMHRSLLVPGWCP